MIEQYSFLWFCVLGFFTFGFIIIPILLLKYFEEIDKWIKHFFNIKD